MKLHGSLQSNLEGAVLSARRHREREVYAQTIAYWTDLLVLARSELTLTLGPRSTAITKLASELEAELAARPRTS
jgi:hypothetical protein